MGGFGVRYVEIKDFACGSSMVCRKTANRSMRIVRLVGIKPLHSVGVRRYAVRGRLWEKCALSGASLWQGVVNQRYRCVYAV